MKNLNLETLAESLNSDIRLIKGIIKVISDQVSDDVTDEMVIEFWEGNGGWSKSHFDSAVIEAYNLDTDDDVVCWGENSFTVKIENGTPKVYG